MEHLQALLHGNRVSHVLPFLWLKGEENHIIREEMDKIQECGISEFCVESRPHPDFCGPGWWHNMDFILAEAKKRGMRVWILDDDKFPTGHANGGFEKQPHKKKLYLGERHMDICGPCRNGAVLVGNFVPSDGTLIAVLAVPKPDGESLAVKGESIIDLTDTLENGFVYFELPEGRYRLFVLFTTHRGGGREDYMNLIDSDSVKVLIEEVYEKHYERYAEYFGNTVAGFFSDEPELGNVKGYPFDNTLGQRDIRLPWSAQMESVLRERWGAEFVTALPALWYDSGERTPAIRSAYMDELTKLVKECFSGQVGKWCEEHGIEYIGHVIEDDNAHTRMACSIGHYFREMEGQHMSGVDVVHHQIVPGFTEPVHQWIAGDGDGEFFHFGLAKLGSSAAHIQRNKKGRALCELFGNYGWAEGNSFMKWLTNHMLVRGINEFTPHAFSMNYPDRDCPPHFYAGGNNPGFGCFAELMKYMNRAAHFLSGGIHLADAAILYHAEAEWSGGKYMYFHKPGRKLMERQLDYDVIPADILKDGSAIIEDRKLVIGEEKYSCLILPYAEYLDRGVAEFVKRGCEVGLKVFVIAELPRADRSGKSLPENWGTDVEIVSLSDVAERVHAYKEKFADGVPEVIGGIPELRSFLVRRPDGIVAMYFNEHVCKKIDTQIAVNNAAYTAVTVYNPWENRAETYAIESGKVFLTLEPGEAVFLAFEEKKVADRRFPVLKSSHELKVNWRVSKKGEQETEFGEGIVISGTEPLPGLNTREYWPDFTGTYRYEGYFEFEKDLNCEYQLFIPEAADCVRVWLNGVDCGYVAGFPGRTAIAEALKSGRNQLVLEVYTTLVWKRKDGASTHLQVPVSGITMPPVVEAYV